MPTLVAAVVFAAAAVPAAAATHTATADGTAIDFDFDGRGDGVFDGLGSVLVGFDAHFGPGEYRGVHEFDLASLPRCGGLVARLHLNLTGTFFEGGDRNLALYAAAGDGVVTPADFEAGSLVRPFVAWEESTFPFSVLDVSAAVRSALAEGATHVAFFVRPNVVSMGTRGAFLFSSNEIVAAFGFLPNVLEAECGGPVLELPDDLAVDATTPAGAEVTFVATASDDTGPLPVVCSSASGTLFAIGTTTVTCSVTDEDGVTADGMFVVHVRGAAEQLARLSEVVASLPPGTSLADKIDAATQLLGAGETIEACRVLGAFRRQVEAQLGKLIAQLDGAELLAASGRISGVLAC